MSKTKNSYNFQKEDVENVLEFATKWHMDPTKQQHDRTNQGRRGYGGEIDAHGIGKLAEIGCCKIIEKFTSRKIKLLTDFNIYPDAEVKERADPDVDVSGKDPNVYVEIKRLEKNHVWLGPRQDQIEAWDRWEERKGKEAELFMLHASLEFDDDKGKKEQDITGSLFKRKFPTEKLFEQFSDFSNLYCKIEFAYPFSIVKNFGRKFEKDEIAPKAEFDKVFGNNVYNSYKDNIVRKGFSCKKKYPRGNKKLVMKIKVGKNGVTVEKNGDSKVGKRYGYWEIPNKFEKFTNEETNNEYIYCPRDTTMFNKIFGKYELKKDFTYKFHYENKLVNGTKNQYDWWFLRRRLNELIKSGEMDDTETVLKEIARKI